MSLDRLQRADLVTARGSLRRAAAGADDVDFETAASMIDRVLANACPHDPSEHYTAPDLKTGRPLVTCPECGVTWYGDYGRRLADVTSWRGDGRA